MRSGQFDEAFRQRWFDDKRGKREILLNKLERETNPKDRKKLAKRIARYRALITMGPEAASDASRKANVTRRL